MKRTLICLTLLCCIASSAKASPGRLYHVETTTERVTVTITPASGAAPANTFNVGLSWTASTSAAGCTPTSTPACSNFGYNLFVGTTSGGEGTTPVNSSLITGTTYSYAVTLTSNAQTFFFVVQAAETVAGLGTLSSANSNEASAAFPGIPAPPTSLVATP